MIPMTGEEKPPLPPPILSSRTDTSYSLDKTVIGDPEAATQPSPRPSWVDRLRMAYTRRASRRPSPPTTSPIASHPLPHVNYDDYPGQPEAGPSKKVRLQIDTALVHDLQSQHISPTQHFSAIALTPHARKDPLSPRPPIRYSQSAVSTDETAVDSDPGEPSMLILLREDYFSLRNFWRTANRRDIMRKAVARPMWKWYLLIIIAAILSALLAIKHDKIVHWLHPIARKIRHWPAGFMLPIVILVILSFPPLVGHEIIGILIGLVWDLGKGFAILAAGTFLGEIALWISFVWCCKARAVKFEKKNKLYSSLTTLIREKTFVFVLVLRFSAVPGHITTAVSASAGANFWLYLLAAFLTLPKQFAIVYLGSAFGTKSTKNTLISTSVMAITIIGTLIAAGYIYYQMRLVMRRKAVLIPVAAVPLGDQPTWADVATAEQIARRQSHMAGHNQKIVIVSPDGHVASPISLNPGVLRVRDQDRVFPDRGHRGHTPTRAWSVPHRMSAEEYKEYIATRNKDLSPPLAPSSTAVDSDVVVPELKWQDSFRPSNATPHSAHPRLTRDDSSLTLLSSPPRSQNALYPPPPPSPYLAPDVEPSYTRGTVSLDMVRTNSDVSRPGGRQIADDSDLYAYVRGGRRPDLGRARGDSRAPLLGQRGRESSFGSDVASAKDGDDGQASI